MIKHVVFDFDGTIVDSRYLAVELLNQLAEKYRFRKLKEKEFEHFRSLSIMERCKAIHVPVYMIPIILTELRRKYQESTSHLTVFMGVKELIRGLKEKGFELSIISSNSIDNINKFLRKNNIDVFDSIYSSSNYFGKDKALNAFLRKHKLNGKDVVYIGDECRDIVACKKNNVKIISVSWGYDSIELLAKENPDFIVKNPRELFKLITLKI
ncbi:HAD-IA family hydrolase [Desulfoscipio geothermicus]|uniref:Phosphoglycolate phosphatase n=1 Tax=Desulfoscipio geothermicus DSM 3669 TaxID=1121426 RepID=A0A1I6E6D1_9FIRM|nr:HAD-IA family hydrolase [Desulfoscipio geothermicus]SFR13295.1 phosphoglycolate phosphatase [Desulfoscipio geothermicus DSM 3669]